MGPSGPPPGPIGPPGVPPTPPPPYGGGGYGAPAYGPPPRRGMSGGLKFLLIGGIALLVFIALIVGLLVFLADDAEAGEIFLDPAGATGRDPFTSSVSVSGQDDGISGAVTSNGGAGGGEGRIEIASAPGDEVGLYGGTENQSTCDREQLIDFLQENEDKGRAWADVQSIAFDEIEDFVLSLTPLRLRFDTRVTNHGFRDGEANDFQSILQAGTAVLVDDRGVPRVRCACGNPLLEPEATSSDPTFRGDRWDGFSVTNIQRVTIVNQTINNFTVTNITNNTTFIRPAGTDGSQDQPGSGTTPTTSPPTTSAPTTAPPTTSSGPALGTGDVQVTLRWSTDDDLDLHVIDPNGEEINFSSRTSSSGGQLDFDCIPSSGCDDGGNHVENVFWPPGQAPSGSYSAFVRNLGSGAADFTLDIIVGGENIGGDSGSLEGGGTDSTPVNFTVN